MAVTSPTAPGSPMSRWDRPCGQDVHAVIVGLSHSEMLVGISQEGATKIRAVHWFGSTVPLELFKRWHVTGRTARARRKVETESSSMAHAVSPAVTAAMVVVGQEIRTARQERGWTIQELADRAGVSEKTVRSVEAGSTTAAVGTVFELGWLVGLNLLGRDEDELPALLARGQERLSLAPRRVHKPVRAPRPRF